MERVAVTQGKGQNSFTKRKTGECFQWKANGSFSKRESYSCPHTRASGNRETTAEEVENARVMTSKGGKAKSKHQQTDVKSSTSLRGQPCDWS